MMTRPVVVVVAEKTRAKHGPWDDVVELVPADLVDRLQQQGCLVVVLPSVAGKAHEWSELAIRGMAGIVMYSVEGGADATDGSLRAFADERSLPVLHVSGDGSVDDPTFAAFASQVDGA